MMLQLNYLFADSTMDIFMQFFVYPQFELTNRELNNDSARLFVYRLRDGYFCAVHWFTLSLN